MRKIACSINYGQLIRELRLMPSACRGKWDQRRVVFVIWKSIHHLPLRACSSLTKKQTLRHLHLMNNRLISATWLNNSSITTTFTAQSIRVSFQPEYSDSLAPPKAHCLLEVFTTNSLPIPAYRASRTNISTPAAQRHHYSYSRHSSIKGQEKFSLGYSNSAKKCIQASLLDQGILPTRILNRTR